MNTKKEIKPNADFVFEMSWEVCNQVGGIHTVLKTKMPQMIDYYGENICMIGPYFPKKAKGNFKEESAPESFRKAFAILEKEGIKCHFGKWLIKGEPKVILIDFTEYWGNLNKIKTQLWEKFKVDSLKASYSFCYDFDEPVVWSWASGRVLEEIFPNFKGKKVICHFHEWASGGALLYLKMKRIPYYKVFTTHATMLGRTLADNKAPLYSRLKEFKPVEEAYKYGVEAKHLMEKASAENSDVFTTVSEITSLEAEYLLEKKPDLVVPNGLNLDNFGTFEEVSLKHKISRERIRRFIMYHFFPYYTFDIENTLLYFLAGRYEFHNKGIDTYIKSLGKLNKKLKKEGSEKTIINFFWVPADARGIKREIIESKEIFNSIEGSFEESWAEIKSKMLYELVEGKNPSMENILDEELIKEIERKQMKMKRKGNPPLATHDLNNNESDGILNSFKKEGLLNKESDPVKVIFYPIYLNGNDGLLNLEYRECIQGAHLGIFPSFYEPWGYTPMETAGLGVVSVTSDVAGFGKFIEEEAKRDEETGVFVVPRFEKSEKEEVDALFDVLYEFYGFTHKERVKNKIKAREIASLADWNILIKEYIKAHNLACSV